MTKNKKVCVNGKKITKIKITNLSNVSQYINYFSKKTYFLYEKKKKKKLMEFCYIYAA